MAVYKSKIKIIEAIEFDPQKPFDLPSEVKIHKDGDDYKIYNRLHGSWINIKQGDMIRIDQPNDHYPIDKKYFEENYLPIEF